jgi:hypothetical protein
MPLFNQMILNLYHPGDGLNPHVDLMKFQVGLIQVHTAALCRQGISLAFSNRWYRLCDGVFISGSYLLCDAD